MSNKCNPCKYACSDPSALRTHLKTHGEKKHKIDQCDFACIGPSSLWRHLKHKEIGQTNETNKVLLTFT